MAENNVEPEPEWSERALDTAEDTLVAMENLLATLRAFEDVLRQQDISITSSTEYCDNFCQALMHYAGSRNSMDHGLPLLEVYCLSINCFAVARSHLTAESDRVALVLKRLALSCFELFLSVPENEIPYEAWLQFHQSVQLAHGMLLDYGSTDLQALLQITGEGGAWCNPVLTALLTGQPTDPQEVDAYISLEGEGFMEMRVKHLEKMGELAKAVVLAKACVDSNYVSNKATFRQTYVSLLCHLLPNEEAISEISRLECKDVLEITCNLETEGDENTAFILCTTFLTQQLQQRSLYCSWELILLWSKLQRRLDPTLVSFLERCLQLGAIAKTVHHLLYLVRVIQTEVEELGVAPSVELCVKALQLPKQDDSESRVSVCKTVSCLLSDDLEVCRACLLTEFLLGPSPEVFHSLQELYLRPDQKYDQENVGIPNSLRCELLLALKSYWPFDPEFWDWKTLKHHCAALLGLKPESEGEDEDALDSQEKSKPIEPQVTVVDSEIQNKPNGVVESKEHLPNHLPESQTETKTKTLTFRCQICKRSVSDVQLAHHSKRHAEESMHPCPICVEKFQNRKELLSHLNQHLDSTIAMKKTNVKAEEVPKQSDEEDDIEPGQINVDPSLIKYYQSTHDPDVLHHIVQQATTTKKLADSDEHVTFDYIYRHFNLQNRDEYPCPGTGCPKVFKHSKYLYVHLKSEHRGNENVRHFQKMRDKREKCAFCRRHLVSAYHYRKHRKIHHGDQPYMCLVVGCDARFRTSSELVLHKQSHGYQLNYQCELKGCYVTFADLGQVYHHEAQHFRDAAYTCTAGKCQKYYLSKKAFVDHLATHKITFSEHDFEAQRKAKRKRFKSSASEGSGSHSRSDHSQGVNGDILPSSSCTSLSQSPESREAKNTLVAVCFDGSKFTCGFEKCGMTFSRARDVQRHLKCAHPEHLKMENKEHKHDRERDSKSKMVKSQSKGGINEKGQSKAKMPFLSTKSGKEKKSSSHSKNHEGSVINDALKEIVIGLGKLDLNCSSSHNDCPPELTPETDTCETSLHQAIMEKPPVVVLQKKILHLPGAESEAGCKQSENDGEEESLASAKPYVCGVKSCGFRTARGYSLLRHYTALHGRTPEQARKLTSLKDTSFKPYICQLCSKALREKSMLRVHYIQKHNLSATLVDKISCGSVHCEGNKTTKLPEQTSPQTPQSPETETLVESNQPAVADEQTMNNQNSDSEGLDSIDNKEETDRDKEESENGHQGRAKRLVAKSNLCYILDKFSKPFHCVAKNCDAAFSTQGGLVRHLQLVHHYNRSQLLLENDFEEQNLEARKESPRKRPSNSDEPQPQYKCHFANCHHSYHLKSSLARHTRDCHSQPELIRSKYDGCHNSELNKHPPYNQCDYYDSLVVRLQSTHKNSLSGCQKKLIVTSQSPQKEEPDTTIAQSTQSSPKPIETNQNELIESPTKIDQNRIVEVDPRYKPVVLRSHEEALQMCQDRCLSGAYPCMVLDCETVVKYMRSLHRHYLTVHHLRKHDLSKYELVFTAEQLEEMIQKKSTRSTGVPSPTGVCSPNRVSSPTGVSRPNRVPSPNGVSRPNRVPSPSGVQKMEYQTEAENPGGRAAPMSLHPIKAEAPGESGPDPLGFPEEEEEEQPSVERNGVLLGADEVLYGEPSTGGHTKEPATLTQNEPKQQERLSLEQIKPLLRPVTVDLSPPRSLRFITEEGFVDLSSSREKEKVKDKLLNGSVSVSITRIREPLKRKNDLSEQSSNVIDPQPHSPSTRPYDISAYKPVGFESSFLNFIKDNAPIEKTVSSTKRQNLFKRSGSVKENKLLRISHSRRRTHSPLVKPHSITSIQNLKSILDKALAGCGDLAIKQLQYLRPVVVLGRPVCPTTLSELFPADTNNSKLLLGS